VQVSDLHTKRSPTQSDIYQMLYWYNWFSWWWARGCSEHVENWNKHIENNRASSWLFTKDHNKMDDQQNIKEQDTTSLKCTEYCRNVVMHLCSATFYIKWITIYGSAFRTKISGFLIIWKKMPNNKLLATIRRPANFWVITQRVVVIYYRRFGTTYRSHLEGSRILTTHTKVTAICLMPVAYFKTQPSKIPLFRTHYLCVCVRACACVHACGVGVYIQLP